MNNFIREGPVAFFGTLYTIALTSLHCTCVTDDLNRKNAKAKKMKKTKKAKKDRVYDHDAETLYSNMLFHE